jgi:hypothetical protein
MRISKQDHSIVATYESDANAEAAVLALQQGGLDMTRLSIVGAHPPSAGHAIGFYVVGDKIRFQGRRGVCLGGLGGLLRGGGFFLLPAIGSLVAIGPVVRALTAALEKATAPGALAVLCAALTDIGLPIKLGAKHAVDVARGRFLVIANARGSMVEEAYRMLAGTIPFEMTAQPIAGGTQESELLS